MIVIRIWEGLGNQLFQYAYARYLEERYNNQVLLEVDRWKKNKIKGEDFTVRRDYALSYFCISLPSISLPNMKRWNYIEQVNAIDKMLYGMNHIGWGRYLIHYEEDMQIGKEKGLKYRNHYMIGHFHKLDYLENIRPILLEEFQLKRKLMLPSRIESLLSQREVVAVHIRRGDYLAIPHLKSAVQRLLHRRYYEKAVSYMEKKVENPVFFFFSDDLEWVKENISCEGEHYYMDQLQLKDYQELILMSKCKHHIIANSTFSFWGAWLCQNDKQIVIAPTEMNKDLIRGNWFIM